MELRPAALGLRLMEPATTHRAGTGDTRLVQAGGAAQCAAQPAPLAPPTRTYGAALGPHQPRILLPLP